ncbi:MAG: type II toxin-antitoxin system RelE/ParE family toxin [gamma proteobacterium symbiont of Taylorina sp.]|nr:type II toxin-antitoxin system RelE/ParE family toxin [gamma proteobacterium symbiont of Taylorina sp.]
MNILLVEKNKMTHPLYLFFDGISEGLRTKIYNKFQSYVQHGNVYHCKHLKTLNSKIWKYKGTIYKLRIDNGKESSRVLFSKSKDGNLKIIHAFLKSTRKTPAKEAKQAIAIYQMLECLETVIWDSQSMHC